MCGNGWFTRVLLCEDEITPVLLWDLPVTRCCRPLVVIPVGNPCLLQVRFKGFPNRVIAGEERGRLRDGLQRLGSGSRTATIA